MDIKINSFNINSKAHSKQIKDIDKIMRNIRNRFPMHSATKMYCYNCYKKSSRAKTTLRFLDKKIDFLRSEYALKDKTDNFFKMLDLIETLKVGNCYENAKLTSTILKAEGYDNVSMCALYAFNKKKNRIYNIDHVVTAINLDIPPNYKSPDFENVTRRHLLKPSNKTIIVDSWGGKTDFAKSMLDNYRGNIKLSYKPADVHKIYLLPFEQIEKLPEDVQMFLNPPRKTLPQQKTSILDNIINFTKKIRGYFKL